MLCYFLLCNKMNQSYEYIHSFPFGLPSHLGHRRALGRVPCALQQGLISYLFYIQCRSCICQPQSPSSSYPPPSRLRVHIFVLYVYVSISTLQIRSPVLFFQIPYICININNPPCPSPFFLYKIKPQLVCDSQAESLLRMCQQLPDLTVSVSVFMK